MRVFKNQVLGGTTEDSQGECLSLEVLRGFAAAYQGMRQPLNQGHDLSKRSAGYIENIRIVDHPGIDGAYVLIGDIYCDESRLEEVMHGFSISYLEVIRHSDAHELIVYLPYPHYNDTAFVQSIGEQAQPISVGKWVKKASDPAATALIGAAIVFLIKPVWDNLYKTVIAPKVYEFIRINWQTFKERKISADFV